MRRSRLIGAAFFGVLGFNLGAGTGIVAGPSVGVPGVLIFTAIGAGWGLSLGPDLADWFRSLFRRLVSRR